MKAVLISIRPNWCKLIWSGMKTVEVRKTRPKLETPFKVYIYCTEAESWEMRFPRTGLQQMNGRIIGEFVCDDVRRIGPEYCIIKEDIESAITGSCLTVQQVRNYAGWKSGISYADLKDLYGWHISNLKIYNEPKELQNFTGLQTTRFGMRPIDVKRAPQSWSYVEEIGCE